MERLVDSWAESSRVRPAWLDGGVWELGFDDFPGVRSLRVIQTMVLREAKRCGVVVRTSRRGGAVRVQVSAEPVVAPGLRRAGVVRVKGTLAINPEVRGGADDVMCGSCGHPVAEHRAGKGTTTLFCQAAKCACRVRP